MPAAERGTMWRSFEADRVIPPRSRRSRQIDPFVIQMYGLGSAAKDEVTVKRLKEALGGA